jgi:hypothetical protein
MEMGFPPDLTRRALELCAGQIEHAVSLLAVGDVSPEGLERIGLAGGPDPQNAIPLTQLSPDMQAYVVNRLHTEPGGAAWGSLMSGKPIRAGIPQPGGELQVFVSPDMLRTVSSRQAPPTAGFGYGPSVGYDPVGGRGVAGGYRPTDGYNPGYGSSRTNEIEKEANEAIGQLTEAERQTVDELSREGFHIGDVFQAFLLCSKDVTETREMLRSLK